MPFLALIAAYFLAFLKQRFPSRQGSLAVTVLFLASLGYTAFASLGYINLMAQENTRMTAGRWIATHIPEGSTLGTVNIPWSYQLPPFNDKRHKVVIVGEEVNGLREKLPDYFVVSQLQWRELDWQSYQPYLHGRPYRLGKGFRADPNVFGITFDRDSNYLDMINISPAINIYKLSPEENPPGQEKQ